MLSEIDIRDWEDSQFPQPVAELNSLDYFKLPFSSDIMMTLSKLDKGVVCSRYEDKVSFWLPDFVKVFKCTPTQTSKK